MACEDNSCYNGWTPSLAIVQTGVGSVVMVTDWIGGSGTKPKSGVYVGREGYTENLNEAVVLYDAQGPQGPVGTPGPQGAQGAQGRRGDDGLAGAQGERGPQGAHGQPGEAGGEGPPGTSTEYRFAVNGSFSTPPALNKTQRQPTGWTIAQPQALAVGQYLWEIWTYVKHDNTMTQDWSNPRRVTGINGSQGVQGPQGSQGVDGANGLDGTGINPKGHVDTYEDLPMTGNTAGDAYLVLEDGMLYIWDGTKWPLKGEGIPFRGENASNVFILDLTNENASVPATFEGVILGSIPPTSAKVYNGNEEDTGWTFTAQFISCTGTINSVTGEVTVTNMTGDSARVVVGASKAQHSGLTATYTLSKVKAGAPGEDPIVYYLVPSVNVIKLKDDLTYDPVSISCVKHKKVGNNAPAPTTEKSLRYQINNGAETDYTGPITITSAMTKITFKLYDTTLIDIETVHIIKDGNPGTPGEPGDGIEANYIVTERDDPAPDVNGTTGWTALFPNSITNTQSVWVRMRDKYGDGTFGPWRGPIKMSGEDGTSIQGPSMAYRGDWSPIKNYAGTPFVVDVVKYLPNGRGYIARADVGQIPVGTLPTNTNFWNEFTIDADAIFTDFLFAYSGYIQNLTVGQIQTNTESKRATLGYQPTDSADPTYNAAIFSRHGLRQYHATGRIAAYIGPVNNFIYNNGTENVTVDKWAIITFEDAPGSPVFFVLDSVSEGGIQYRDRPADTYNLTRIHFLTSATTLTEAHLNTYINSKAGGRITLDGTTIQAATAVIQGTSSAYEYVPGGGIGTKRMVKTSASGDASNAIDDGWYLTGIERSNTVISGPDRWENTATLIFTKYVSGIASGANITCNVTVEMRRSGSTDTVALTLDPRAGGSLALTSPISTAALPYPTEGYYNIAHYNG